MHALAREDGRCALCKRERNDTGPAGVRAESNSSRFHAVLSELHRQRHRIPPAEAQGSDSALQVAALQFVKQRDQHARA